MIPMPSSSTHASDPQDRYVANDQTFAARQELRSGSSGAEVIYASKPPLGIFPVVDSGDRMYLLREFLAVSSSEEDGLVCVSARVGSYVLPFEGIGDTYAEAISDFCEVFDVQYRYLAEASDEALSEGALGLAQRLRDVVDSIE